MPTGARYTYTETSTWERAVSDMIAMIDWEEAPLLRLLGLSNQGKFKITGWPGTKVEWIEDTLASKASALSAGVDNSTVTIPVTTGHGYKFRQGDIILIDSEKMLVTSVTTDSLTVATRPYGSTSAASHDSADVVTIVGRAMPEGANATTGASTDPTLPYNYAQIISQAVQVSGTEEVIQRYGIDDPLTYQMGKLFSNNGAAGELAQALAKTFYYGERVQRSASAYGSMGGFKTFVTTNVTALSSAALQKSDIHTKIRAIRVAGGRCTHIVGGSWAIEKITQMYEGNITRMEDATRGGSVITKIITPHGQVEVIFDWMCPEGELYFFDKDKLGWVTLRPFTPKEIAPLGDYTMRDIVGEYSCVLQNQLSHGLITGFSTTA